MLLETTLGIVKFLKSSIIITVRVNVNEHHLREKQNKATDAVYDRGAALLVSHPVICKAQRIILNHRIVLVSL